VVRIGRGGESQSQSHSDIDSESDSAEGVWKGIERVVRGNVGRLVELDQGGLTDWARVDKVSDRTGGHAQYESLHLSDAWLGFSSSTTRNPCLLAATVTATVTDCDCDCDARAPLTIGLQNRRDEPAQTPSCPRKEDRSSRDGRVNQERHIASGLANKKMIPCTCIPVRTMHVLSMIMT
jgi:hypothetical protein